MSDTKTHVVVVGAGFAGIACAHKLVKHPEIHITLIDKNNYHQFTPLLYQVATAELSPEDVATTLRNIFDSLPNIDIKMEEVVSVDPKAKKVSTKNGEIYSGDFLVLAAGSIVNFFDTAGAALHTFPLYNLNDAEQLRSRILTAFEEADRDNTVIEKGALNFVIVGAGPTGTELAGALADMVENVLPRQFSDLLVKASRIYLVDYGHAVLGHFSESSQSYAAKVLQQRGVELKLGVGVKEVASGYVILTDDTRILTHTVVWAGGLKASLLSAGSGLSQGHGGRIDVQPDFSVAEFPGVYAIGDFANIPANDGQPLPQLASVAEQSGQWCATNILAEIAGKQGVPFQYNDKGIMAMIGRNAAVVEIGKKRHELEGIFAFATWLGVHAVLMSSIRQKISTFIDWAWNYFGKSRCAEIIDRSDKDRS